MTLQVNQLSAGYGNGQVLNGVSFDLSAGEIVTILGRNGSGRSTTCKALMGIISKSAGRVSIAGRDITSRPSHEIAKLGLGYVPEERIVFKQLTVEENLRLGQKPALAGRGWTTDEVYQLFPRLAERRNVKAGYLSGGEQQMLTIFRTILGNPSIIMIDEPTEGLAPMIVERIGRTIVELKKRGLGVLLLEQKLALALDLADRVLVMGHGQIVFAGTTSEFSKNDTVRANWLEVG